MKDEEILNKINYLEGGLKLIKKELHNSIKDVFINFKFTKENINKVNKIFSDYKLTKTTIKELKSMI